MPTYEYACKDCGEHLEVVQSFREDSLTQCPNCEGRLRKVFSAAGIIFKGSGWHVKDYAPSSKSPSGADSSESSESSAEPSSSAGESASKGSDSSSDATSSKSGDSGSGSGSSDAGSGTSKPASANDKPARTGTANESSAKSA